MSLLQNYLTAQRFFYEKNSRHANNTFGLDNNLLYNSLPRMPFEYYVKINLNNVGTAQRYISDFYSSPMWAQVTPLVKTAEMPSMKIETEAKNQYNRKRLSQHKIDYDPVKIVFHDVADGKTLKFWDMYYRYYFADGNEPGMNIAREVNNTSTMENQRALTAADSATAGSGRGMVNPALARTTSTAHTQQIGNKRELQNIVRNTLDNHLFGYNLSKVGNIRSLIESIEIFQVHAGRFNQVTLVNPRISAFSHDTLNYSESGKTLELSFTFEYEYAFYTIQNLQLGGTEVNNTSSTEQYANSQHLEIPSMAFTATLNDFIQSNNPTLTPESAAILNGRNVQKSVDSVYQAFPTFQDIRRVSSSVLDGTIGIGNQLPTMPQLGELIPKTPSQGGIPGLPSLQSIITKRQMPDIQTRPFKSAAKRALTDLMYKGLS